MQFFARACRSTRRFSFAAVAAALSVACSSHCATTPAGSTTIYVVRHAEKAQSGGDDPALTDLGRTRALDLVTALRGVGLHAIYATQYRRTQQTVRPAAKSSGLKVRTARASGSRALAAEILSKHRGETVLVAGHSNTIPELLAALGINGRIVINEKQYGDLYVVTVSPNGAAQLQRRRFGD